MTTPEVIKAVQRRQRMTHKTVRRYIRALEIKPLGTLRRNPIHWPDDTAKKILMHLGIGINGKVKVHLPSMPTLKLTRAKARGKK